MNTKLNYLYRDADNYKMPNSCVVIGEISEAQIAEVISCSRLWGIFHSPAGGAS